MLNKRVKLSPEGIKHTQHTKTNTELRGLCVAIKKKEPYAKVHWDHNKTVASKWYHLDFLEEIPNETGNEGETVT